MTSIRFVRDVGRLDRLSPSECLEARRVAAHYPFLANRDYLSLIDWEDPDDPIRAIIVPRSGELEAWGRLDASDERQNYVAPGCQHKYPHTVLVLVNDACGGLCRFCFRKRLFIHGKREAAREFEPALAYIRSQPQVTNVLLTGGDALLLPTKRLEEVLRGVREIPHVQIIRIGTKLPAYAPRRIIEDPELAAVFSRYSTRDRRIYLMVHINHPRELTADARLALDILGRAGVVLCNQSPILRGINADPATLAALMRDLSIIGVPPYYFFQCRPTAGNRPFAVPIVEAYAIFEEAKKRVSGLAKRARFVMSHATGKIEIVGVTTERIFLRYHRARDPRDEGRFIIAPRDDEACWLDDLAWDVDESVEYVREEGTGFCW
ncbi:MAG: KamA family radical SAM protein [Planctomycetes bacterium]|nr:KamA family radical SAM protein [Planctomycetota bacterium]